MLPSGVHEHVADELEHVEVGGYEEVQPEEVVQVNAALLSGGQCAHKGQNIDDEQILGDGWNPWHDVEIVSWNVYDGCKNTKKLG